ncbi:MAG: hypothetical protein M3Y72_08580 [Acidobacteriota bacterium]|nr:hypothetical protein [Acidobacteriota bacterium]
MKNVSPLSCVVFLCAGLLSAQTGPPGGGPPSAHGFGDRGMLGGRPFEMGMHFGKVITGQPYSADVNTSSTQTLSDGNTINRVTSGHVARDSQGRTYLQQNISGGPWAERGSTTITFISDPVAGYTYVLNPNSKVAMRREFKPRSGEQSPPPPPDGATTPDAKGRVESDLGQQTINGVIAAGKSITRTIPAGAIGNAQPIVEKSDIWTASDLQVVVLSKHSDPRSGNTTYTLNNIQRTAPKAELFQVPSDYSVKDAPAFPGRR